MKERISPELLQLLLAVLGEVKKREGGFATKTKLLKLIYLADLEFYRRNRRTLSGAGWIFYKFGPWFPEYEQLLQQLELEGSIRVVPNPKADIDSYLVEPLRQVSFDRLVLGVSEALCIKNQIAAWADVPTGELLDYVYFMTEPMRGAERNTPLDFSSVPTDAPSPYRLRSSGITPGQAQGIKRRVRERFVEIKAPGPAAPPRYDDIYAQAIAILQTEE